MTFLPIVERELRVTARRRATYWSRLGAAGLAFVLFAMVVVVFEFNDGTVSFGTTMGPMLFGIFSWLSFAFVAVAGVFLTSDALSEEKREGTLGLLFLTDLRGYDVVIGKLLSTSLTAAYALMAAFPVIGISFLLGGVTGAEFWRLVLVLFNTMFFSLTIGLFVSALSRDGQRAMNGTVLLCTLFLALLPTLDWAMAGWDDTKFVARLSLASPGYTFSQADQFRFSNFWPSFAVTHLLGWLFLAAACVIAPRAWQETSSVKGSGANSRAQRRRFGAPMKRLALRQRLLAENPVRWLAARDGWLRKFQWMILLGIGALFALLGLTTSGLSALAGIASGSIWLLALLVILLVASQASRFLVEAMRSGTIELLLATPLCPQQIVRGQFWALRRVFLGPALVVMLLMTAASMAQMIAIEQMNANSNATMGPEFYLMQIVSMLSFLITFSTGLMATAWFGMWMGLTTKKANVAVFKTIVFVQILPTVALWFVLMLIYVTGSFFMSGQWYWLPEALTSCLAVAADLAFIHLARKKLLTQFRELATRASGVASPPPKPGP